MTIAAYFWGAVALLSLIVIGLFGLGFAAGKRTDAKSRFGVFGLILLIVFGILVGGAKSQETRFGPLFVYEASWLASAINFSLAAGYLTGRNRARGSAGKPLIPMICALIAAFSVYFMAIKLHEMVDVAQQLGIGRKSTIAGPNTGIDCKQSLTKIYAGFVHYAEVNDALPPAANWMAEEDLHGAIEADEWLHCPDVSNRKDDRFGYAFNDAIAGRKLKGKKLSEMPDAAKTPLVFDSSNLAKSAHDAVASLPKPGRHAGANNVLYCDGHVEALPAR